MLREGGESKHDLMRDIGTLYKYVITLLPPTTVCSIIVMKFLKNIFFLTFIFFT